MVQYWAVKSRTDLSYLLFYLHHKVCLAGWGFSFPFSWRYLVDAILHSFHFRSNVPIGRLQSRIVVLFLPRPDLWVPAPHDRIFRKYFVACVVFTATPPCAWDIAVGLSCCRSFLALVGLPKEGYRFGVDVECAACATSARFAFNQFTDRSAALLFHSLKIHLVFIEPEHSKLSEYYVEVLITSVSVVSLCSLECSFLDVVDRLSYNGNVTFRRSAKREYFDRSSAGFKSSSL